jgi:hypothetical protein
MQHHEIVPGGILLVEKNGVSLFEVAGPEGPRYVVSSVHTPAERRFADRAAARAALESWVANGGVPKD